MSALRETVLITGSSGQVGGRLAQLLRDNKVALLAPSRMELDLLSPKSIVSYITEHKPAWIINAAAYTAVDKAESEPEMAYAVNAVAPGVIGEAAAEFGIPVIHYSTDYVFSGEGTSARTEEAGTQPMNTYGLTKLEGERALSASGAPFAIFRTSWVYGARGNNFLLTILKLVREREELKIVADQHGAPTTADSLARLAIHTMRIANKSADPARGMREEFGGIYHACNSGETTWFGFAEEILRLTRQREPNVKFAHLIPIRSDEFPVQAQRPLNSRMNCALLSSRLHYCMPSWKEALHAVIQEYYLQNMPTGS